MICKRQLGSHQETEGYKFKKKWAENPGCGTAYGGLQSDISRCLTGSREGEASSRRNESLPLDDTVCQIEELLYLFRCN